MPFLLLQGRLNVTQVRMSKTNPRATSLDNLSRMKKGQLRSRSVANQKRNILNRRFASNHLLSLGRRLRQSSDLQLSKERLPTTLEAFPLPHESRSFNQKKNKVRHRSLRYGCSNFHKSKKPFPNDDIRTIVCQDTAHTRLETCRLQELLSFSKKTDSKI